jgi:hypothetical protein
MKNLIMTVSSSVVLIFAASAMAQKSSLPTPKPVTQVSEFKPHVGLLLGAAQPEGSGITASEVAVDIGYQPYIPFGLAAEFNHSRIDDGDDTKDRNTVWLKGSYNFGGTTPIIKSSYMGVALGTVFKSDGTSLALAPILGFDIPVARITEGIFSLGASARYEIVGDDEVDTLALGAVAKYWY